MIHANTSSTQGKLMFSIPHPLHIACGALIAASFVAPVEAQSTGAQSTAKGKPIVIRAEKAWLEPGKSLERARFTVRGDEISEVAQYAADSEAGDNEITGAVLTAGFIDLHNTLGPANQLSERIESFTPELRADKAYDPFDALWKRVLAQGVTSLVYAPNNTSVAGGQAILVRPGLRPEKDAAATYLKFSLTKAAQTSYKRPTSLIGALEYLRENYRNLRIRTPRQLTAGELILASTVGGNTSVGIACNRAEEILSALELSKEQNLDSFLILGDGGAWDPRILDDVLDDLAKNNKRLLLPALDMRSNKRAQALPARLDKLGIPFAFSAANARKIGVNPIQWTLAMAMRAGLSADKALAAVTTTPATWSGIGEKAGSLYKGRQADLCLWTGDPWDLRSRLLVVIRAGRVVYDSRKTDSQKNNATMEARR